MLLVALIRSDEPGRNKASRVYVFIMYTFAIPFTEAYPYAEDNGDATAYNIS